jgi:ATP synthase I chain
MLDSTNTTQIPASAGLDEALNSRVFRTMAVAGALAVAVSIFIAPWRVTSGLLVGSLLALFSHSWLKNSAAAAIHLATVGGRPQFRLVQFLLRYAVIAAVVFSAYTLDLISLPAVFVGLSSLVVAIFVEAGREFYFAITKREENS